ncbi:MAG: AAA family ATPase [Desulfobacteria bacterium]
MKRTIWSKLKAWQAKSNRKPLILKGARQVGKTYILKAFGRECFPRFHYVNFEKDEQIATIFEHDLDPKRIVQELCFHLDTSV